MKRVGAPLAEGFTIIEVMLFLAISGGLVAALLITVGVSVERQRFSDTIVSTQAFVQEQINETLNVINDRTTGDCTGSVSGTSTGSGSVPRGTSDCVILGRALDFTPGSSHVTTYNVVGVAPAVDDGSTGAALLSEYHPGIDSGSVGGFDIPWDQHVYKVHPLGPTGFTRILLLRSPESGSVLTFSGGTNVPLAVSNGISPVNVCFDSQDIATTISMVSLSDVSGAEGVTTKFGLTPTEVSASC